MTTALGEGNLSKFGLVAQSQFGSAAAMDFHFSECRRNAVIRHWHIGWAGGFLVDAAPLRPAKLPVAEGSAEVFSPQSFSSVGHMAGRQKIRILSKLGKVHELQPPGGGGRYKLRLTHKS